MKKAAIIIVVVVVLIAGGLGAALYLNPDITSQLAFFGTEQTEPETQPQTEPETQPQGITELTISGKSKMKKGESASLSVKYSPATADAPQLSFTSSDSEVATVDENGLVKAVSMGECEITAQDMNSELKSLIKIEVSDEDIQEMSALNEYLLEIPDSTLVSYGGKSTMLLTLRAAAIADFNDDGRLELVLSRQSASGFVFYEVVTLDETKKTEVVRNFTDYDEIFEGGYTSYKDEVLTDDGSLMIKTTAVKEDESKKTRTRTVDFTLISSSGVRKTEYEDKYTFSDAQMRKSVGGEFTIDGEKSEEESYLGSLSAMSKGFTSVEGQLIERSATITMGDFTKIEPVYSLDSAYEGRIEWKSDKPEIAQVNSSGVVTGVRSGSCVVTGVLDGVDTAVARAVINVRESSKALSEYHTEAKNQSVTTEDGKTLSYVGGATVDIDADGSKELLLYYKGGSVVRLDVCEDKNGEIERNTAFTDTDASGDVKLELYVNNANDEIVLNENIYKSTGNGELRFKFYEYKDGGFEQCSSEYRIVYGEGSDSSSEDEDTNTYYQDNNTITAVELERQTGHYTRYMDIVEGD